MVIAYFSQLTITASQLCTITTICPDPNQMEMEAVKAIELKIVSEIL